MARRGRLDVLAEEAAGCQACDLWRLGTQTVFGRGPLSAEVVLVGEQPGDQEDIEGEPFVGPAGRVLDDARGRELELDGRTVVATIHPSAVLRTRTSEERAAAFDGLVADLALAARAMPGAA